jgi:malate dehydrogenase
MKVTILGASGVVGAPTAFYLATKALADEIVMIGGKRQNVLKQHIMDISTAVSAQGILIRAGTYEDMKGSQIVINAAGAHVDGPTGRVDMLSANIPFIKEISQKIRTFCPDSIVITATNPVGPLNYATYLAGRFDRRQVIGYSLNDTFRFRELVAHAFGVRVDQVEGCVIGEHGPTQVLLFSSILIDGSPVLIRDDIKENIRTQAPDIIRQFQALKVNRTAGWTCAVGLESFVRAIVTDSGDMLPCSLVLNGEYQQKGLSMTVPARIGRQGVQEIIELKMDPDEEEGLKISTAKLENEMRIVEDLI